MALCKEGNTEMLSVLTPLPQSAESDLVSRVVWEHAFQTEKRNALTMQKDAFVFGLKPRPQPHHHPRLLPCR